MLRVLFLMWLCPATTLSKPVSFTAGPVASIYSSVTASPNTIAADGTTTILRVVAKDAFANPVTGQSVTLSGSGANNTFGSTTGATDANGVFTTTLSSTQLQTETVTATLAAGVNPNTTVQFVAGAPTATYSTFSVSPASQIANNANLITATLTLKDAAQHPVAGQTPTFSYSGSATTMSTASATNASGQSSITYRSGLSQNENALVTAGGLSFVAAMSFVAGPPFATTSSITASPNNLAADGIAQSTIAVTARDAQGNLCPATTVSLAASGGNNTFASTGGSTNASGQWSTTLKSTQIQSETLTATLNGNVTVTANVAFVAGNASASTSTLVVNPNTQIANNSNTIVATLTLKDSVGHPIASVLPTFGASGSTNTISAASATNASGQSAVTFKTALAQNENATVSAGGLSLAASMVWTAGPATTAKSSLTLSPNTQISDHNSRIGVAVRLADAFNNPVSGQSVLLSIIGSATPLGAYSGTTSPTGAFTTYLTSPFAGTNTLAARSGTIRLSATAQFTSRTAFCASQVGLSSTNYAAGSTPRGAFTADINLDSQPDMVLANLGGSNLSVFLNVGNGSFGTATSVTVGSGPWGVVAQDVSGDGIPDLVAANNGSNTLSVLLGTGSGTFGSATNYNVGNAPQDLAVGDINNDGMMDVMVANHTDNTISVFLGTGGGALQGVQYLATDNGAWAPALGDFNGDGNLDIALGAGSANVIDIFIGNGQGGFAGAVPYNVGNGPMTPVVGDLNGDGILDLVINNFSDSTISILLGSGSGSFGSATSVGVGNSPYHSALLDINGDGLQDLAVANTNANTMSILLGNGNGGFSNQNYYNTGGTPDHVIFGDYNMDQKSDLAVVNSASGSVTVFLYSSCLQ